MRFIFLFCCLALVGCGGRMPIPDQLREIDAALRERGVTPQVDGESWSVKVPPEVIGPEVRATFYWNISTGNVPGRDYLYYCTVSVSSKGEVYVRPTFRTDKENERQWPTKLGQLGGNLQGEVRAQFPVQGALPTEHWLQEVFLKNIREPNFPSWMKELD